jgi:CHAT domain-containing protein
MGKLKTIAASRSYRWSAAIGLCLLIGSPIATPAQTPTPTDAPTPVQTTDRAATLAEANRISELGFQEFVMSRFENAIGYWQKSLVLYRSIGEKIEEGRSLGGIGSSYDALSQYDQAMEYQEKRLALAKSINDRRGEGRALGHLGEIYENLAEYEKAIDYQNRSLKIAQEINDRGGQMKALGNLGVNYFSLANYKKALEYQERSLKISLEIKDRVGEYRALGNIGVNYFSLSKYDKAIEYQEKSLAIAVEIKDKRGEGNALGNLGLNYYALNDYPKAIDYYNRRIAIAREIKDRRGEANALGNLGLAYYASNEPQKAIDYHLQRIKASQAIRDLRGEGQSLGYLGNTYFSLSDYAKAIEYQEKSLEIAVKIKNKQTEGKSLGYLGNTYFFLGNYPKAIEYQSRSLAIAREIGDGRGESQSLGYLGLTYHTMGDYAKALEYHQQRLPIALKIKDRRGAGNTLANLGLTYHALGQETKALEAYQQSLAIAREINAQRRQGSVLGSLGVTYEGLGDYAKAIDYHEQSLAIARDMKDKEAEGIALNNMGSTLVRQKQPELAIVFYKQSVNVREGIRKKIEKIDRDLQESYTQTVASTYRTLADLLLSQGRVLEAQQVLELLKIQELRDYTRDTRTGGTTQGSPLNPIEQPIPAAVDDKIAIGSKLTQCEQTKCAQLNQLISQRDESQKQLQELVDRLKNIFKQQEATDPTQLQSDHLRLAAQKVILANPQNKTVLVYPLVLEDKLWLVWGSQAGNNDVIFNSKSIPVSRKQLSETVGKLQSLLSDQYNHSPEDLHNLQKTSQQLYQWLIEPIRLQLNQNGVKQIVFSLDRATRYIPMAALHDGKQYLIENFAVSTILTADTDTKSKLSPKIQDNTILGLGLTQAVLDFTPLPNVKHELDGIIQTTGLYPGTKLFDRDFTENSLRNKVIDHRILHIATHGQFVSGNPEDSFLVLGDGNKLSIPNIKSMKGLDKTHLVVLSACETGKGGVNKEGIEVAGMGHYFLLGGAKSVMPSLWLVNDPATSVLMREFYRLLSQGTSKSEALRQVQIGMLTGKLVQDASDDFRHPYYWSPFILIGNSQ